MVDPSIKNPFDIVALFTRAWIEIFADMDSLTLPKVALFTRAWIEIENVLA